MRHEAIACPPRTPTTAARYGGILTRLTHHPPAGFVDFVAFPLFKGVRSIFGDALTTHLSRLEDNKRLWKAEGPAPSFTAQRTGDGGGGDSAGHSGVAQMGKRRPARSRSAIETGGTDGVTAAAEMYNQGRPRSAQPTHGSVRVQFDDSDGGSSGNRSVSPGRGTAAAPSSAANTGGGQAGRLRSSITGSSIRSPFSPTRL